MRIRVSEKEQMQLENYYGQMIKSSINKQVLDFPDSLNNSNLLIMPSNGCKACVDSALNVIMHNRRLLDGLHIVCKFKNDYIVSMLRFNRMNLPVIYDKDLFSVDVNEIPLLIHMRNGHPKVILPVDKNNVQFFKNALFVISEASNM